MPETNIKQNWECPPEAGEGDSRCGDCAATKPEECQFLSREGVTTFPFVQWMHKARDVLIKELIDKWVPAFKSRLRSWVEIEAGLVRDFPRIDERRDFEAITGAVYRKIHGHGHTPRAHGRGLVIAKEYVRHPKQVTIFHHLASVWKAGRDVGKKITAFEESLTKDERHAYSMFNNTNLILAFGVCLPLLFWIVWVLVFSLK